MFGGFVTVTAGAIEPQQGYTWGINNQKALALQNGQIITAAVLTFHNFRSDIVNTTTVTETTRSSFRSGSTTTTTIIETPNYDSLKLYVLDNPRYGFAPLRNSTLSKSKI